MIEKDMLYPYTLDQLFIILQNQEKNQARKNIKRAFPKLKSSEIEKDTKEYL